MSPTTLSAAKSRAGTFAVASAALAMLAFRNSRREALVRMYRSPHLPAKARSYIVVKRGFRLQAEAPPLFSIHGKRQQHVARHAASRMVPRVEEDHPAADRRTRSVQRAASSGDSIDSLVLLDRVVVPHDQSIRRRVGPHVAVDRA